jgi:hypothetical protein
MQVIKQLKDQNDVDIVSMGASWTSKAYPMDDNLHLCVHLFWDALAPQGTLTLEYSGDPLNDGSELVDNWVAKDVTNVDGNFEEVMYLDANLPAASFRIKFQHISGSANLSTYIVRKRG